MEESLFSFFAGSGYQPVEEEPPLDRGMCMDFAAQIIESALAAQKHRKKSKESDPSVAATGPVEMYLHKAGREKYQQSMELATRMYVVFSVGYYYHEGHYPRSTIACLEKMRESQELWYQQGFKGPDDCAENISRSCPVTLVVAGSHQAINDIAPVDIDLTESTGQCVKLLLDPNLAALELEDQYVKKGSQIDENYRKLFGECGRVHQKKVKIEYDVAPQSIRWHDMRKHFSDPGFQQIVNYLERCFKYGLQKIIALKASGGKKKSLAALFKSGALDNWSDDIKLNDVCYKISEVVVLFTKIFPGEVSGELIEKFILYSGPLKVLMGSGKHLLCKRFPEFKQNAKFTLLRAENRLGKNVTPEEDAERFSGKLDEDGLRLELDQKLKPDQKRLKRQVIAVGKAVKGTINRAEIVNAAIMRRIEFKQKERGRQRHVEEKQTRKREERQKSKLLEFSRSKYARFINDFSQHCQSFAMNIKACQRTEKLVWNSEDPMASMIALSKFCTQQDENVASPVMRGQGSLTDVMDEFCFDAAENLLSELEGLQEKQLASNSNKNKHEFLLRAGARLIAYAADAYEESERLTRKTSKRRKIDPYELKRHHSSGFFNSDTSKLQRAQSDGAGAKTAKRFEKLMAMLLFAIDHLKHHGISIAELVKRPDCFIPPKPEYNPTQESQTPPDSLTF